MTSFAIGFRGPAIWNKFITENEKSYTSISVFKNKIKEEILSFLKCFYSFKFILLPVILFSSLDSEPSLDLLKDVGCSYL